MRVSAPTQHCQFSKLHIRHPKVRDYAEGKEITYHLHNIPPLIASLYATIQATGNEAIRSDHITRNMKEGTELVIEIDFAGYKRRFTPKAAFNFYKELTESYQLALSKMSPFWQKAHLER